MKWNVLYFDGGSKILDSKYPNTVGGYRRATKRRAELSAGGFTTILERK